MKNITKILLIGFVLMTILISCFNSGDDKFLGTWKSAANSNFEIKITKAGNTAYTSEQITHYSDSNSNNAETFTLTYQDGNLVRMGMVFYSYSNGKLICNGMEYKKVE